QHTRFSRDWSSDVCSSDLWNGISSIRKIFFKITEFCFEQTGIGHQPYKIILVTDKCMHLFQSIFFARRHQLYNVIMVHKITPSEIGRASCRERESKATVDV